MNQSETNAAATPASASIPRAGTNGMAPWAGSSIAGSARPSDRMYDQSQTPYTASRQIAPTTEIWTWCALARSPIRSERPSSAITESASRSSVAVSLGNRRRKRIGFSPAAREPATTASPRTSSALAKSEPRIDVCATTTSPAERAKRTMKSSGRLPSVDWRTPVTAWPNRTPTDSVAAPISQASPARATPARRNTAVGDAPA